jgi:hypothetical protein
MTKRYTGGVISSSLPTVNAAGASGVFLLSQQADYQSRNAWPPYKIEESLRFRVSAGAYLNRTPSSAGNRQRWTWSAWVKRGSPSFNTLFAAYQPAPRQYIAFYNDQIYCYGTSAGADFVECNTTAVFRDFSAWYHIVFAYDTTQATGSNRVKVYVNGTEQALTFTTTPSQNSNGAINGVWGHFIGAQDTPYPDMDGYMSEINFIDGQALTPASFGATDKDGNWSPIAYTGAYGTNGFYLNFSNNTSATTMGLDSSGNGNNWTLNGFNVSTANTSYDIMIDVPEDQAGANNRGNYCTWNPAFERGNESITDGMLNGTTGTSGGVIGTIAVTTGKWYWETVNPTTTTAARVAGLINFSTFDRNMYTNSIYVQRGGGYSINDGSTVSYGSAAAINDIIGVALDVDARTVIFYLNGVAQGSAISLTSVYSVGQTVVPAITQSGAASRSFVVNFGQRPWAYAPPAGYKALCTTNLPEPTIKQPNKYMDTILYTGDGTTSKTVSGLNFQPDWVWIKARSQTYRHSVFDVLRGFGQHLQPSFTDAENTVGTTVGTSFFLGATSTGFTVGVPTSGTYSGNLGTNENGTTYVGWNWKAGDSTVTNTSGSISSQVRANPTAGFSIVTWSQGASSGTVGHGLGVTPSMIIGKTRSNSGFGWHVYHSGIGVNKYLFLNLTNAPSTSSGIWSTLSSTVFGASTGLFEANQTQVAYCFAEISGFSAFGRYTGNGSTNGPFVHTGFRPKFIMIKNATTGGVSRNWAFIDSVRSYANVGNHTLAANLSDSSSSFGTGVDVFGTANMIDLLSNGFKIRDTGTFANSTGADYIYMAFAEMPFKYARAR